ncbi:hypothetical protein BBR01nite_54740 [Brevibacillus brevis]|nr:hypothetical protein BBR01nite_54740 [Brevibacillus brevis]
MLKPVIFEDIIFFMEHEIHPWKTIHFSVPIKITLRIDNVLFHRRLGYFHILKCTFLYNNI